MPFQVALVIGYVVAISLHFTLQRLFVWSQHEGFALPIGHQAARYLVSAGVQYGVTAASVALLPRALGLPTEVVYLVTIVVVVCCNFLVFRYGIFHAAAPAAAAADER
jgi:putative flippase GtrA